MTSGRQEKPSILTPLWIVASFLTLTELVLGYAVTRVTGGIQVSLTIFVLAFPVLVGAAFFITLWNRPWVFYSPSEYGTVDPEKFLAALKPPPAVASQIQLLKTVEQNPLDEHAKFALIDSMADPVESQFMILMHESERDVPRHTNYIYESETGGAGSGGSFGTAKIEGTGLVRVTGNGAYWSLTDEGRRYAKWLIEKRRKFPYFWSPFGQWGSPKPGGFAEKAWIEQNAKIARQTLPT